MTTRRLPLLELIPSHSQTAVDEQHLARDERSLVGAQEPYRAGDVFRISEPAERCCPEHRVLRLLRQDVGEPRADVSRRDDVGADAAAAELTRQRLREAGD